MTDNHDAQRAADAQQDKSVFIFRVIRVIDQFRVFIKKTVRASSNETPCFFSLEAAFLGSHSNRMVITTV